MRRASSGLVIVLALAWAPAAADGPEVRVHAPAANSVVSGGGQIHVIVEISAEVEPSAVRARLKGADLGPPAHHQRPGGNGVLHWSVQLAPGPNQVEVESTLPGKPAVSQARSVYYFAPILSASDPPKGFKRVPCHPVAAGAICSGCHHIRAAPGDIGPASPDQSTCHSCHASLTKVKEVHGPTALWACTKCHNPEATPQPYATPDPVMPLCFSCHEEQKERFYGRRYQHGPTSTGRCTICHNPHGTENQFFIKKAAWRLCTTCHFEKASGRHVIAWGPNGQGHPTHGKADPSRPNRELSCASCHNPHAAPAPKLWNFEAVAWLHLCRNCHRDKVGM